MTTHQWQSPWGDLTNCSGLELALMLQITGLLQDTLGTHPLARTRNEKDRAVVISEQDRRRGKPTRNERDLAAVISEQDRRRES